MVWTFLSTKNKSNIAYTKTFFLQKITLREFIELTIRTFDLVFLQNPSSSSQQLKNRSSQAFSGDQLNRLLTRKTFVISEDNSLNLKRAQQLKGTGSPGFCLLSSSLSPSRFVPWEAPNSLFTFKKLRILSDPKEETEKKESQESEEGDLEDRIRKASQPFIFQLPENDSWNLFKEKSEVAIILKLWILMQMLTLRQISNFLVCKVNKKMKLTQTTTRKKIKGLKSLQILRKITKLALKQKGRVNKERIRSQIKLEKQRREQPKLNRHIGRIEDKLCKIGNSGSYSLWLQRFDTQKFFFKSENWKDTLHFLDFFFKRYIQGLQEDIPFYGNFNSNSADLLSIFLRKIDPRFGTLDGAGPSETQLRLLTQTAQALKCRGRVDLFFKFVYQWLLHSLDTPYQDAFLKGIQHLNLDAFLLKGSNLDWVETPFVLPGFQLLCLVFSRCRDLDTRKRISNFIFGNKKIFITMQELNISLFESDTCMENQLLFLRLINLISQSLDFQIKHNSPTLSKEQLFYLTRLFHLLVHLVRANSAFESRTLIELEILSETTKALRLLFEFLLQNDRFDTLDKVFEPLTLLVNTRHRFNINQKNTFVAHFYLQVLKVY